MLDEFFQNQILCSILHMYFYVCEWLLQKSALNWD